ncbi:hypothetical protein PWT90_09946 [Aphanocladium album]|nr:hypothetical protein PWT90_09946 [Aphanocladium album]
MDSSPFSRPQTPPRRTREIAASDDEGSDSGFSDDSLEDLSTLLGGGGCRRPQAAPREDHLVTPQAKRAAHSSRRRSSPPGPSLPPPQLSVVPKHRFDLKALAKDARRDTALQASSLRAQEPMKERTTAPSTTPARGGGLSASSHSVLSDIVNGSDGKGKDAHKVLRAVQRADQGHQELRYCFFKTEFDGATETKPPPPPPEALKNPWSLLTKGSQRVREQNLISGVPFNVVGSQGGMPDAIFLWVLEEVCTAKSTVARTELCNLILICPEQIASLLTPELMKSTWERLGVEDASIINAEISVAKRGEDVYKDRDWAPLLAVLSLLRDIAPGLLPETRKYTTQLLLRMAMDRLVVSSVDIDNQFEHTFTALIDTIPPEEWDSFCHDTCTLLKNNFSSQCIRINALLCLPASSHRAHDLRRRLAIAFLFPHDASLTLRPPEEVLTLHAVLDRLARPDFQVGPATEFAELRAAVLILDMAVDDGSVLAAFSDPDAEDAFNAQVDALAARLNEIWRRTNDAGMKLARTEAKSVVEWVQKRVTHTVRTRRKPPKSIFDLPGQEGKDRQRRDLPRQQEFMKNFFRNKIPSPQVPKQTSPQVPKQTKQQQQQQQQQEPHQNSDSEPESVFASIVVRGG